MKTLDLGSLRRVTPIARDFGYGRGQPVDRYYIEHFLGREAAAIRGHVLEIGDDRYTRQFGGDRVVQNDVLDLPRDNQGATITADLTAADHLCAEQFDCIICTQTLQFIYALDRAVYTLHRLLRPGGVLLCSLPVVSQICRFDMDRWGDYWRFTTASAHRLLAAHFGAAEVAVGAYGNVLAATCLLYGLAASDLTPAELDFHDPDYQVVITARAVKKPGS